MNAQTVGYIVGCVFVTMLVVTVLLVWFIAIAWLVRVTL